MFVYGDTRSTKKKESANGTLFLFGLDMEGVERVGSEYSLNGCRADPDRARRREFDLPSTYTALFSFLALNKKGVERVGSEYSLNGCRADPDRARRRKYRLQNKAPDLCRGNFNIK